jgi:hypothetical protein
VLSLSPAHPTFKNICDGAARQLSDVQRSAPPPWGGNDVARGAKRGPFASGQDQRGVRDEVVAAPRGVRLELFITRWSRLFHTVLSSAELL